MGLEGGRWGGRAHERKGRSGNYGYIVKWENERRLEGVNAGDYAGGKDDTRLNTLISTFPIVGVVWGQD